MRLNWFFAKNYQQTIYEQQFGTLDQAFTVEGEAIDGCPISQTSRVTVNERRVYVKKYYSPGSLVRRFLGRSRIRGEWENLQLFKHLNIPAPTIIACGERRGLLCYDRGILVMEEIENSQDLRCLLSEKRHLIKDKQWVLNVATQLMAYAKRLHEQSFIHSDLKFRNVLIKNPETDPQVYFIDCPIGRRRYGCLFERARVKELFELDKYARFAISKTLRLRCYLLYRGGQQALTKKDKTVIREIMRRHKKHDND